MEKPELETKKLDADLDKSSLEKEKIQKRS